MKPTSILFVLLLMSMPAGAERPDAAGVVRAGTNVPSTAGRGTLWQNLPDGPVAVPSHNVTNHTDVTEGADDAWLSRGTEVTTVEWWGVFAGGQPPASETFVIRFYCDSTSARLSTPGVLLYEETYASVARDSVDDPGHWPFCYHYQVQLDPTFLVVEDDWCWVSVQALYDAPPQWYWLSCSQYECSGAHAVHRSDAEPEWRQAMEYGGVPYDFAFRLSGEQWAVVPDDALETSWGRVKSLYREPVGSGTPAGG
jgi:hypothetical protein